MPVRSLNSSVLKWPDAQMVHQAVCEWARQVTLQHPEVLQVGYFGSYARGDWGVGSDLDLVLIVSGSEQPFIRRASLYEVSTLPVPADLLVYTKAEWHALNPQAQFTQMLQREVRWVYNHSESVTGGDYESKGVSCDE